MYSEEIHRPYKLKRMLMSRRKGRTYANIRPPIFLFFYKPKKAGRFFGWVFPQLPRIPNEKSGKVELHRRPFASHALQVYGRKFAPVYFYFGLEQGRDHKMS